MSHEVVSKHLELNYIDGFTFRHYNPKMNYMLNDEELLSVFNILQEEIGVEKVFYSENLTRFDQFKYLFSEYGLFTPATFIFVDGLLGGVCWLTGVEGRSARLHFFTTKYAQMTRNTVKIGRATMKHWARMKNHVTGEPILQSLIGVTPKSYKLVLKYIQKVGFTIIGEAKGGIHFYHRDEYDDAVISTIELKEEY